MLKQVSLILSTLILMGTSNAYAISTEESGMASALASSMVVASPILSVQSMLSPTATLDLFAAANELNEDFEIDEILDNPENPETRIVLLKPKQSTLDTYNANSEEAISADARIGLTMNQNIVNDALRANVKTVKPIETSTGFDLTGIGSEEAVGMGFIAIPEFQNINDSVRAS